MNEISFALQERFLLQKEFLGDNKPINRVKPIVSVLVSTYKHSKYISECLDGILMQQTSFQFEIIIGEDGSTDGTKEICEKYAVLHQDKIRLFNRDRKLSQFVDKYGRVTRFNGIWNRMSARGTYIALCEGDDYWTDSFKLQKQYEFLESNAHYNLVFSPVKYYSQSKGKFLCVAGGKADSFEDLLKRNTIPTLTTFFRKEIQTQYYEEIHPESKNWLMGDYPMWLYFATKGKIGFISEPMGVYRVLESSLSHSKSPYKRLEFDINRLEIADFFSKYFQVPSVYINSQKIFLQWEYSCRMNDKNAVRDKIQELKKYAGRNRLRYILIKYSYMCPRYFIVLLDGFRKVKGMLDAIKNKEIC